MRLVPFAIGLILSATTVNAFGLTVQLKPPLRASKAVHGSDLVAHRSPAPGMVAPLPSIGASAALFGAANALGFGISAIFTNCHYHLDLLGTGCFAVVAWVLRGTTLTQQASAAATGLWATKLTSFLVFRALITKNDARLDQTLSTTSGQIGFWFISFLWGWLVSLPHTLAAGVPTAERPSFGAVHIAGLSLFALGFIIETAADLSKWTFKANPLNAGKFCDAGIWKLSQHPNWLGNLMIWTGILLLNAPTLLAGAAMGPGAGAAVPLLGGKILIPAYLGALCRFGTAALGSTLFLFLLFNGQGCTSCFLLLTS